MLLAAGECQPGLAAEIVLDLVPQRRSPEAGFDQLAEGPPVVQPAAARAVGDVLEDRHRERVGALEDHANAASQLDDAHVRVHHVLAVEAAPALDAGAGDQVVHAVEAAQERRLAAARRADQGQDGAVLHVEADVTHRDLLAIADGDVLGRDLDVFRATCELVGAGAWRRHFDAPEHWFWVDSGGGHLVSGAHAAVSRRVRRRPRKRAPRLNIRTMEMRIAAEPSTIWFLKMPRPSDCSL